MGETSSFDVHTKRSTFVFDRYTVEIKPPHIFFVFFSSTVCQEIEGRLEERKKLSTHTLSMLGGFEDLNADALNDEDDEDDEDYHEV